MNIFALPKASIFSALDSYLPTQWFGNMISKTKCENIVPTWYCDQGHQRCAHFWTAGGLSQHCKHNMGACSHSVHDQPASLLFLYNFK